LAWDLVLTEKKRSEIEVSTLHFTPHLLRGLKRCVERALGFALREQRSNPCGLPSIIGMISMHETMVCMVGIRLFAAGFGMVACVCVVFVC
jgi:hypothetical protein